MTELFNIHMASDLSEWTSTVTDSGDLSQAAAAGLAGTSGGLSVLLDDTVVIYGQKSASNNTSGTARVRFYIDPNTITQANTANHVVFRIYNSSNTVLAEVFLGYRDATGFYLSADAYNDAGSTYGDAVLVNITDAEHYVEINLTRSTGTTDNNGSFQWWLDGVSKYSTGAAMDNYDRFANFSYIRAGAVGYLDAATSGTYYMDEIAANDDGTLIGPVAAGGTAVPVFMNQYRQRAA